MFAGRTVDAGVLGTASCSRGVRRRDPVPTLELRRGAVHDGDKLTAQASCHGLLDTLTSTPLPGPNTIINHSTTPLLPYANVVLLFD